jgi:hypothetical protein
MIVEEAWKSGGAKERFRASLDAVGPGETTCNRELGWLLSSGQFSVRFKLFLVVWEDCRSQKFLHCGDRSSARKLGAADETCQRVDTER